MANPVPIKSPMYLLVFTNNAGEERQEDRIFSLFLDQNTMMWRMVRLDKEANVRNNSLDVKLAVSRRDFNLTKVKIFKCDLIFMFL